MPLVRSITLQSKEDRAFNIMDFGADGHICIESNPRPGEPRTHIHLPRTELLTWLFAGYLMEGP